MTIIPLECKKCGAVKMIETDVPERYQKERDKWEKKHAKCKEKKQ